MNKKFLLLSWVENLKEFAIELVSPERYLIKYCFANKWIWMFFFTDCLNMQISLGQFSEEQEDMITKVLREIFCKRKTTVSVDYHFIWNYISWILLNISSWFYSYYHWGQFVLWNFDFILLHHHIHSAPRKMYPLYFELCSFDIFKGFDRSKLFSKFSRSF